MLSLFAGDWTAHAGRIESNYDLRHRLVEGRYPAEVRYAGDAKYERIIPSVAMPHPAPTPACPSFFTVNDNGDASDATPGDGVCATAGAICTLRAAIEEANALSSCGVIDINFSGVTSPISLGTALPAINHNVNLNGPGANLLTVRRNTAGGTPNFSVLSVQSGGTTNISGLTISGGNTSGHGGGIFSGGSLTLANSTVSGNATSGGHGGGIYNNGGTLILTNSTVSGNTAGLAGGGIYNNGQTLTLTNSTVGGNTATTGGGIFNNTGTLTLTSSTVSGNKANSAFGNYGGGIYTTGVSGVLVTLTDSTVSGNRAGSGGGIASFGTLTLTNSTVSGNTADNGDGGGIIIVNNSTTNLKNTIVAKNKLGSGGTGPDLSGTFNSQDYNLIGNTSGVSFTGTTAHNITNVDPLLGPLANNGGPTLTHSLLPGSPAIDAGINNVLTTDQRGAGFNRAADGDGDGNATVDIGAFEVQSILVTNTNDSGAGSLRQAIIDANTNSDSNAINFQPGLIGTITLLSALPDLSTSMSINGPGANLLTVMRSTAGGTPQFRIFRIPSGVTVTMLGLTIANGLTPDAVNGGGIYNLGTLNLTNSAVSGNQTANVGFGGGIYTSGAKLTLINSTVSGTTSSASGGGIYNNGGTVTLTNSMATGNNASGSGASGGGIDNSGGTLTLLYSTVSGNSAPFGGGLENDGGVQTLTNSTISGNTAGAQGGGIYNASGTLTLTNSTVSGNTASNGTSGGGVFNPSGTANFKNTLIANNTASSGPDLSGTFNSQDYNLIGNTSGVTFTGTTTHNVTNVNALLGPLADNGGPTLTHALLSGSPAIDAGNNASITNPPFIGPPFTDQRGGSFNRIADGDCNNTAIVDIGAYELQAILTICTVNPPAGRTSGGQQIVLTGAFAGLSSVTMGGASASWFYTNGAGDTTSITVTTPAHAVGAVQIDLTPTSGSPYSKANAFAYLLTVFTDDTIMVGVTTARAQHIIELRQAVDAMRAVAGLSSAPWTDPALASGDTIKAIHILDLRTYLDDAATRLGYSTSPYTDPGLPSGFVIKRIHIEELRQRIRTIAG